MDDNGQQQRDAYLAAASGTNQMPYQGYFSASQVLADAAIADQVISGLAAENKPITNMYGDTVLAGGQPLTAFDATAEQRANSYLLNTPTAAAERQQMANQRQATLSYLAAINGGAPRDYTLEEVVLGGAIGGRAVDAIATAIERGTARLATAESELSPRIARPSPRQSEIDVGTDLPPGARPQVSYLNGNEVPYGTPGSVRPDWCIADICSVEVKNYDLANNSAGLIRNVSQQAVDRANNLPHGMSQTIVIDARGQTLTPQLEFAIRQGIVTRSNGVVLPNDITFKSK